MCVLGLGLGGREKEKGDFFFFYKELAHTATEAEKSQYLQFASWRPRGAPV